MVIEQYMRCSYHVHDKMANNNIMASNNTQNSPDITQYLIILFT